ncbi:hypothetical protein BJF79_36275 [Actinomadura sp. CNU-125]|nr:hypothetical protein BJF79_36275 [Actinomadura sp. CNU-125]
MLVEGPAVRGDQLGVGDAGLVLAARAGKREQVADRLLRSGMLGAQADEVAGGGREALGVDVAVLDDQARDPLRVPFGDPEPDGRAEVEHVHHEPGEAEFADEPLDDPGEPVEREREVVRCLGAAEPGVVGGDEPVAGAEHVDEAPELVGRGRETVQEEHGGRVRPLGERLAVEDAHAVDVEVAVDDAGDRRQHHD